MAKTVESIRQQMRRLAEELPAGATWQDVRYQVELRASIERGVEQSERGATVAHEDILKEFGIDE